MKHFKICNLARKAQGWGGGGGGGGGGVGVRGGVRKEGLVVKCMGFQRRRLFS